MPRCELMIVVDREDRQYRGGQTLRGVVNVEVDGQVNCNGLTLALTWRTHGRGNRDESGPDQITLYEGSWLPGEDLNYAFEIPLPASGPWTYHGEYVNVDWYLTARADIPWKLDPKAEEEILLVPGDDPGQPVMKTEHLGAEAQAMMKMAVAVIGGCLSIVGPLLILIGYLKLDRGMGIGWFFFGIPMTLVGAGMLWFGIRNRLAERRLGPVDWGLEPTRLHPGDPFEVWLKCTPQVDLTLLGIDAVLKCVESATSGSGTNRTTHTRTVYEQTLALAGGEPMAMGDAFERRERATLPDDAPFSFDSTNNAVAWHVALKIKIPRWPDWTSKNALVVYPRGQAT